MVAGALSGQNVPSLMKNIGFTVFQGSYIKKIDYETEYTCSTSYFKPFISVSQGDLEELDRAQGKSNFTLTDLGQLYESGELQWTVILKTSGLPTAHQSHTRIYFKGGILDRSVNLEGLWDCYKLRLDGKKPMNESLLQYTILDEALRTWQKILNLDD